MKTIDLTINPRAFLAIIERRKRIEIRANKNDSGLLNSLNDLDTGDHIIFTNISSLKKIKCKVIRKALYKTVRQLLEKEGTEYSLSSTNDIDLGIKSIESISNYKILIEKYGVFAVELRFINRLDVGSQECLYQ